MCMQRYTQRLSMNSESVHVSVCRVGTAAALGGGSDNALPQGKDSGVCVCVCTLVLLYMFEMRNTVLCTCAGVCMCVCACLCVYGGLDPHQSHSGLT